MGIMDTVHPAVGTGIQPQNAMAASMPGGPTAGAQTAINSLPQPEATPTPPAAPQQGGAVAAAPQQTDQQPDPQAQAVDQIFAGSGVDQHQAAIDSIFGGPEKSAQQGPEQGLVDKMKGFFGDEMQNLKAKFLTGAARNSTEENNALEKAFGKGNVKISGDNFMVRTSESGSFKKFNDQDFLKYVADPIMRFSIRSFLSMPEQVAGLPKMLAQMGTPWAGAAVGAEVGGVPGAMAGGLVGGFGGSKVGKAISQAEAEYLGIADPAFKYENKLSSIGDIFNNDYVNGVIGAVGAIPYAIGAKKAAEAAELSSRGLSAPEMGALNKLTPNETAYVKFKNALQTFASHFTPVSEGEAPVGQRAMGIAEEEMNRLGSKISTLKDTAAQLQTEKGSLLQANTFLSTVKDNLSKHGVGFDVEGAIDLSQTKLSENAPSNISKLMGIYNEVHSATSGPVPPSGRTTFISGGQPPTPGSNPNALSFQPGSPGASGSIQQTGMSRGQFDPVYNQRPEFNSGLTVAQTEAKLEQLSGLANYEKATPSPNGSEELFRDSRAALDSDRISHYNDLFQGEKSVEASAFRQFMGDYSEKVKAFNAVRSIYSSPQKQEMMIKAMSASGSTQSLEGLDAFRRIVGDNSPAWQDLRGAFIERLADKATVNGKINAKSITGYLSNPDNQPLLNRLFDGKTKDLNVFKTIMAQGEELQNAGAALTDKQRGLIDKFIQVGADHLPGSKFAKLAMSLVGNNKSGIDYVGESVLSAMNKAVGPEQKAAMFEQYMAIDGLQSKSQIVSVPTKTGSTLKYMPFPEAYKPPLNSVAAPQAVPPSQ